VAFVLHEAPAAPARAAVVSLECKSFFPTARLSGELQVICCRLQGPAVCNAHASDHLSGGLAHGLGLLPVVVQVIYVNIGLCCVACIALKFRAAAAATGG
jgi:hypothetical protein